ncbi:IclR family transcriptional regulator [Zwartia vadi]|uniref:IclR family transcriptional regulator n=1 Tax=Zwartia vadi TaxID=3058168 RepID=UPI0025B53489|nr:IclR family transcriptional regulator [Zwartia vadi]MDN3987245.1 IclR family transcriptional regulator [Zwartia vadi]
MKKQTESPAKLPRIRPVPAVSRAIAILRLLGKAREPMGVNAIAQALALVPSTCLHILRALVEERLVTFDRLTKHYRLGAGMLSLARSAIESNSFPLKVQPALDRLSTKWGVTAIGVDVSDPEQMVVVALSHSNIPFRLHVDVGSVFPALLSATGRLVAAFGEQPAMELKKRFAKLRWDQPLDYEDWSKEVAFAKKNHYSIDRNTYIAGVSIAAVPVLAPNEKITHTIVCASLMDALNKTQVKQLIREMQAEARSIAEELFV